MNVEVKNCQYTYVFFRFFSPLPLSLSQGSVRQTRYVFRARHVFFSATFGTVTAGRFFVSPTERDAFDTLFDHAPDKLNVVKKTLITFVNKHLNKLNLEVTELDTQVSRRRESRESSERQPQLR